MISVILVLLLFNQSVIALSTPEKEGGIVYKTYDNLKEKNLKPPDLIKEKIGDEETTYYMADIEYKDVSLLNRTTPVTTYVSYEPATLKPIPEAYKKVDYYDKSTDKTVTGNIPLESLKAIRDSYWTRDVKIPITFNGYQSQYYQLGNLYIPYNADKPELEGQTDLILDTLNLDKNNYKIDTIDWSGEAYEEATSIKRNAIALGQRLVTPYKATYKGAIPLPDIKKYTATVAYKETISTQGEKKASENKTSEKKAGKTEKSRWMDLKSKANLIGPISTLGLFGIVIFILSIYRHQKNKKFEKIKVNL